MKANHNSMIATLRTLALLGAVILLAQPVAAAAGCLLQGMALTDCEHCEARSATGHSHSTPIPSERTDCCNLDRDEPATQAAHLKITAKKEALALTATGLAEGPACWQDSTHKISTQDFSAAARTQAQLCTFRN